MRNVPSGWVIVKWCVWAFVCGSALGLGANLGMSPLTLAAIKGHFFNSRPEDVFEKSAATILVLGVDANYGARGQPTFEHARSDVMLLARLDFENNRAFLISIPRDTLARIPGRCSRTKINAACAFGGPDLAARTVEQMLGVEVDRTLMLNFKGFQELVDDIGGVWIDVEKNMRYRDRAAGLDISLRKGMQRLNGYQAMGYVRFRHSDSDFHRSARQQKFLKAVLEQVKRQPTLDMPRLVEIVRRNMQGLDNDELAALLQWGRGINTSANIKSVVLPTREAGGYNLEPDERRIDELFRLVGWPRRGGTADVSARNPDHPL